MIVCENLTRYYGLIRAVHRVSFEIGRGEIVGLLGHNGAGKTTIMKMMTGFLEPTEGRVRIDGLDVAVNRRWAQAKIGYLPENGPLYHDMTVWEFLSFAGEMRGLDSGALNKAVKDAMVKTDLLPRATQSIQTLSRGYRQRVGVAQALLHRPPILIMDEPTNGLDPSQVQQMRSLIRDLARESTVVLSTHILQEVEAVCSRVLIVANGRLALDQKLEDLRKGSRVLIVVDKTPEAALPVLSGLEGVTSVEHQNASGKGHAYALTVSGADPADHAPGIARDVIQKGFSIFELTPERRNLESVFREANEQTEIAHV